MICGITAFASLLAVASIIFGLAGVLAVSGEAAVVVDPVVEGLLL